MEKLLQKIARQLDSLDEASLMALWSKYATLTSRFEPTKRWEEACLIFSLIQAKRWKNQLFNYTWAQQRAAPVKEMDNFPPFSGSGRFELETKENEPEESSCRVLSFHTLKDSDAED